MTQLLFCAKPLRYYSQTEIIFKLYILGWGRVFDSWKKESYIRISNFCAFDVLRSIEGQKLTERIFFI